ncbi:hypothetical protein BDV93DRAFT_603328 [Ceratobasidium sp. AG-I]|nr:hypothetical protein BDV93DRAFT_603328 [Ceratobasidium sp. AG-I]
MPLKLKLKVKPNSDEREQSPRAATSAKKGKRSRQAVYDTDSDSDGTRPSKRRTSVPAQPPPRTRPDEKSRKKSNRTYSPDPADSEQDERAAQKEEDEVDVEGYDSADARAPGATRQRAISERQPENDEDQNDLASTESSGSSSPGVPAPSRKQSTRRAERPPRTKANRIESEDEDDYAKEKQTSDGEYGSQPQSRQADTPPRSAKPVPSMRAPTRQSSGPSSTPTATKPLRKPVGSKNKDKEAEKTSGSALSSIPAIPRRPRDVSAVVKDTQDMDLLNKDVYNQLFNASSTSKPVAKNVQNEAKQKEIDAKRAAAKAALLQARSTSFDLQLPTDKVLAFESRLRKIHRWYAPSALGFTYHEELRNASQRQRQRQQQ